MMWHCSTYGDWYADRYEVDDTKRARWVGRYRSKRHGLIWNLSYQSHYAGRWGTLIDLGPFSTLRDCKKQANIHQKVVI